MQKAGEIVLIGLCHKCLTSRIEVRNYEGEVLCQECFGKKYKRNTPENQPEPTLEDLKKKMEKNW